MSTEAQKPSADKSTEKADGNGSAAEPTAASTAPAESKPEKPKHPVTWDRSMDVLKILATVWVALIGTVVTMQYNERQAELNRIEAIAKMLPHLSEKPKTHSGASGAGSDTTSTAKGDMSRDGAIWAMFRTANSKTMLRDLASLFPEDIYRVVSSTAAAGSLEQDDDALTAIQVASEKLATKYTNDKKSDLAMRLYNQAVRLKERKPLDKSPIHIVDITDPEVEAPGVDQTASLIESVNKLGALHAAESTSKSVNTSHFQAKQLYKRARQLGINSTDNNVKLQVAAADIALGDIFVQEVRFDQARLYYTEGRKLQVEALGPDAPQVQATDMKIAKLGTL
jgi:hypothetical protein